MLRMRLAMCKTDSRFDFFSLPDPFSRPSLGPVAIQSGLDGYAPTMHGVYLIHNMQRIWLKLSTADSISGRI